MDFFHLREKIPALASEDGEMCNCALETKNDVAPSFDKNVIKLLIISFSLKIDIKKYNFCRNLLESNHVYSA
jgi:hypothetical protein